MCIVLHVRSTVCRPPVGKAFDMRAKTCGATGTQIAHPSPEGAQQKRVASVAHDGLWPRRLREIPPDRVRRTRRRPQVTSEIRTVLERVLAKYEEIDRRFASAGGLPALLALYEQVRRELERVSFQEIDKVTGEIKDVIEALLKMSYELRKVHNLKIIFESKPPSGSE